jgi:hypothetical protein
MRRQPELVREWAHALKMLAQKCTQEFAEQILLSGMVEHLLQILASPLPGKFKRFLKCKNGSLLK